MVNRNLIDESWKRIHKIKTDTTLGVISILFSSSKSLFQELKQLLIDLHLTDLYLMPSLEISDKNELTRITIEEDLMKKNRTMKIYQKYQEPTTQTDDIDYDTMRYIVDEIIKKIEANRIREEDNRTILY